MPIQHNRLIRSFFIFAREIALEPVRKMTITGESLIGDKDGESPESFKPRHSRTVLA